MLDLSSINELIGNKTSEIALIQKAISSFSKNQLEKKIIEKASIVLLYSILESFLKQSFKNYINIINFSNCNFNQLRPEILQYDLCLRYKDKSEINQIKIEDQPQFSQELFDHCNNKLKLIEEIDLRPKADYCCINKILKRWGMTAIEQHPYRNDLESLILARNSIAHGDEPESGSILSERVNLFSSTLINLMSEIFLKMEYGLTNKTYLRV